MKFLILNILNLFDFFHKKAIKKEIIKIFGYKMGVFFDVGAHNGTYTDLIRSYLEKTLFFLRNLFLSYNLIIRFLIRILLFYFYLFLCLAIHLEQVPLKPNECHLDRNMRRFANV